MLTYIPQDAKVALNPLLTIGYQLQESFTRHQQLSKKQAQRASMDALCDVKSPNSKSILSQYPHELSGGMAQRAMITMMLIGNPKLLVADEPTSALDEKTAQGVLDLLKQLIEQHKISLMFISHHLKQAMSFCDEVAIMQNGCIVEQCSSHNITSMAHPYVQILLKYIPDRQAPQTWLPMGAA